MHKERKGKTQTTTMKQNSCELKMNKNQQGKIFRYLGAHNFFIRVFFLSLHSTPWNKKKGKNCFRLLLSSDGFFILIPNQKVSNPCHTFRHSFSLQSIAVYWIFAVENKIKCGIKEGKRKFFPRHSQKRERLFFWTYEQQHRYSVKTNPQKLNWH